MTNSNLVTQPVEGDDLFGRLLQICRAEHRMSAIALVYENHHLQVTPEVRAVGLCRQEANVRLLIQGADLLEVGKLRKEIFVKMHLAPCIAVLGLIAG